MKRIFVGIILLIGIYAASVPVRAYIWEVQAENYASKALVAVSNPWSLESLLEHGSSTLKAVPREPVVEKITAASLVLGNFLKVSKGPSCKGFRGVDSFDQKKKNYSSCEAEVLFQKGKANITLFLAEEADGWKINDFTVQ